MHELMDYSLLLTIERYEYKQNFDSINNTITSESEAGVTNRNKLRTFPIKMKSNYKMDEKAT